MQNHVTKAWLQKSRVQALDFGPNRSPTGEFRKKKQCSTDLFTGRKDLSAAFHGGETVT